MGIVSEELLSEASSVLRQPPLRLNCAQSVAAMCGAEGRVDEFAEFGGGRAPEGLCGALYAALQLVPEDRRAVVRNAFALEAGAEKCVEIKRGTGTSCQMCVAIGAALVKANAKQD